MGRARKFIICLQTRWARVLYNLGYFEDTKILFKFMIEDSKEEN